MDDHIVEPPDLFDGRVPAKYQDLAPKLVRKEDGTDVWVFDGNEIPNIGLNAVVGRPPDEYGIEPTSLEDMRPGCFDMHERVRDMNANGVLGSMCFPSFPQFCGQLFARSEDKDMALAMLRAYNDWHIEGWCGAEPGRFIPLSLPVLWDPELAAAEVRRVAAKGCHAVTFSENPEKLGWPSLHSDHWDPFWQACDEEGTIVCMHHRLVVAAGGHLGGGAHRRDDLPAADEHGPGCVPTSSGRRSYASTPTLRFALSEGGIGWIPYMLERVDYVYEHHHAWTGQDFGDKLPSQVFKERIITCFIDDAFGVDNRRYLNVDNICLGVRLPPLRLDVAPLPRGGHEIPGRAGRPGDRQDHPSERHAPLPVRPLQRAAPPAVHGRGAPGRGHRRRPRSSRPLGGGEGEDEGGATRPHLHRNALGRGRRLTVPVHYEVGEDHVARITIDRPEAKNAMDMEHFFQLRTAWDRFGDDDEAWVAVVTGVQDVFFVGADLKTYIPQITEHQKRIAAGDVGELDGYRLDDGVKAVLRGVKLYKPIVAAVNGTCVAGGMEMLGGCDIRVAADTATFGVLEPKRGLFAGGGTTVRLPRQIPYPAAMELLLCADRVSAARAFEMGLLNEVTSPDRLMERVVGLRRPDHRQRAPGRPQDEGVGAEGPCHRHARGLQDRIRAGGRGVRQRGRQGGAEGVRREAGTGLDGPVTRSAAAVLQPL